MYFKKFIYIYLILINYTQLHFMYVFKMFYLYLFNFKNSKNIYYTQALSIYYLILKSIKVIHNSCRNDVDYHLKNNITTRGTLLKL